MEVMDDPLVLGDVTLRLHGFLIHFHLWIKKRVIYKNKLTVMQFFLIIPIIREYIILRNF